MPRPLLLLLLAVGAALAPPAPRAQTGVVLEQRYVMSAEVRWHAPEIAEDPVDVRLLAINDLHGALEPGSADPGDGHPQPVGGAVALAAYLAAERAQLPKRSLLLIAGDSIGASPPISALLGDEPTLAFLNLLADGHCPALVAGAPPAEPVTTRCAVVAVPGNHEFDQGLAGLERALYGGARTDGAAFDGPWRGLHVPFLAANVRRRDGGPLLPSAAIVELEGVRIGVVGAVTRDTPNLVGRGRVADLEFLPEAAAINEAVRRVRAAGAHAVVLVIHEGLVAPDSPQPLAPLATDELTGGLAAVLAGLEGGVDVVVAGHTHRLNNLFVPLADHSLALVVQAESAGRAYASVDLTIDRASRRVLAKAGRIRRPWGSAGPARVPDRRVVRLVEAARKATQAAGARVVGRAAEAIAAPTPGCAESPLGDLAADAERAAAGTELAFINVGGLRAPIPAGPVTVGTLYAVHPFGNRVMRIELTGAQVLRLLEQQWSGAHAAAPLCLAASGLRYVYDGRSAGVRLLGVWDAADRPLDPARRYTVAAPDFLTGGGDHYDVLAESGDGQPVTGVREALEAWIARTPDGVHPTHDGRIERADLSLH